MFPELSSWKQLGLKNKRLREADCEVWGSLYLTLWISRLCGVAPLRLTRATGGGHRAAAGNLLLYIFSLILVIVLTLGTLTALYQDMDEPEDNLFMLYFWAITTCLYCGLSAISVVFSYWTIKDMIVYLHTLNSIHKHLIYGNWRVTHPRKHFFIAMIILSGIPIHVFSVWRFVKEVTPMNPYAMLYWSYPVIFVISLLKELQFIYVTYNIESALVCVNQTLEEFGHSFHKLCGMGTEIKLSNEKEVSTISYLAYCYAELLAVVRKVKNSFNMVLLLILCTVFVQLVVNIYILITLVVSEIQDHFEITYRLLLIMWLICNVVTLTEPCHQINSQINRVSTLLGLILRDVRRDDPLALELSFFFKQTSLNRHPFNAMGICTLSRSLILVIISAVTTYVIIIIQFTSLSFEAPGNSTAIDNIIMTDAGNITDIYDLAFSEIAVLIANETDIRVFF